MLILGSFASDGSPVLSIHVAGDAGEKKYTAVIDTGFTGFVTLPLVESKPLGLKSDGAAASVTLGDGSKIYSLVAEGIVTLSSQAVIGSVILDQASNEILVGLDFLRQFGLGLILTDSVVILYDDKETMEAVVAFMASAPASTPTPEPNSASPEAQ